MRGVTLLGLATSVAAFPFALDEVTKRQTLPPAGSQEAKDLSASRTNCGILPCLDFDPEAQLVSVSGEHRYMKPKASDIRGLCPGLNAAANHGYLNRNGVQGIANVVTGLADAYNMAADLAAFLAAFAVIFNGDPITGTWSIGGSPGASPLAPVLGNPQGIDNSHNNYEGDASISRPDAYLNNGDAVTLDLDRYRNAYSYTSAPNRYGLDRWAQNFDYKINQSINENPYFFSAPFSGLVAPAAYNFVINFMSNHTAEEPSGYLDGKNFKTFFAITGRPKNFVWHQGHERIPRNWYKRPASNQYSIGGPSSSVFGDLVPQFLAYPNSFRFGGNTGTTNSFVGFDFGDLTGGLFDNAATLLEGNNLACFFAQAALAGIPDVLDNTLLNAVTGIVGQNVVPVTEALGCPQLNSFDTAQYSQFPGAAYKGMTF